MSSLWLPGYGSRRTDGGEVSYAWLSVTVGLRNLWCRFHDETTVDGRSTVRVNFHVTSTGKCPVRRRIRRIHRKHNAYLIFFVSLTTTVSRTNGFEQSCSATPLSINDNARTTITCHRCDINKGGISERFEFESS